VNVFFDVDYTILSYDNGIRPGTHEIFEKLVANGHRVYIWSGQGIRWGEIYDHKLDACVTDVFHKPTWDYVERLAEHGVPLVPDFVVDDYPEIVEVFGGFYVKEFYRKRHADDEMYDVYRTICEVAERGTSDHPSFRPRPQVLDQGNVGRR
jgi:hypothetical protein